jgi:2-polyprenyl-6-methoxyphenol hydroxylase-like FAD-dependent oxidoreductase
MPNVPRIAVVGAGPGGLTLARILRLHGINPTIFEREQHSTVRSQGGSLECTRNPASTLLSARD